MSFIKLKKILNSKGNDTLDNLLQRVKDIQKLQDIVAECFDKDTASHIAGCNIDDGGKLTILCDSSSWQSKIRFSQEPVLNKIREKYPFVTFCEVKVSKKSIKKNTQP
tara:strand:+ start:327 stop:650 length:324 start_codon:yes stop_codon:yes gene_type:complete